MLNGRKRNPGNLSPKIVSEELLPLRGFLNCPRCNRSLTGSASKGRTQYCYYYHCLPSCEFRQKAEIVNGAFVKELQKYVPHPGVSELYKSVINDVNRNQTFNLNSERRQFINQIEEQNRRISQSRELLLEGKLESDDYKLIKSEAEVKITVLESKITTYSTAVRNIENILNQATEALSKLDDIYANGDVKAKRQVIGSIFPEKLVFDGGAYRTTKVNEAARLIYLIDNEIQDKKMGQRPAKLCCPIG